jgi:hypothetical protein
MQLDAPWGWSGGVSAGGEIFMAQAPINHCMAQG